ncbi:glycosyltransferase [Desulfovulcanus sp.]
MKLKVLQLGSPTGLYGAERWILALVKHLDPEKIESWVASIKDEPGLEVPLCREAARLGFKTHIFQVEGRFNVSAVSMLRNFIREHGIHILHTHGYKTDLIGLLATRGTPCKIVTTPHGWSKQADSKLWCYEMLDRAIFPFFDALVPLSEGIYSPLKKVPGLGKKLHLIKNGVDISEIDEIKTESPEILSYKTRKVFLIGYIGQLIPRKGLDILLKALQGLNGLKWHLFLVGTGELQPALKKMAEEFQIKERVTFTGFRKDRLELLRGFDVFVLPSRLEGIPRCLMEACAMKKPVIASNIPGCTDIIKDNETGLLFEHEDHLALRQRLDLIFRDESLRKRLGENARRFVLKEYSAKRMAREYTELYFSLCPE